MNIGNQVKMAKNFVTSSAGRQLLKGQKHSPTILFGAGVVGVVATAVMASKATLQLDSILQENEKKQLQADDLLEHDARYSEKDHKSDMAKLKTRLVVDVAKLYTPAIILGVGSICALTGSHVILTKRNSGLVAAYAALDKGYSEYRQRVTALVGEEKERELRLGTDTREIAIDGKNGTEVETIKTADFGKVSQYARLFSAETSNSWDQHPEYNLVFLRCQQQYANDRLQTRGHVLLNDIYDALGFDRTKAGAVVGWVKNNPKGGDNYIDFGIFDDRNMNQFHDFMTGREGALLLDFNVDGIVYDLL